MEKAKAVNLIKQQIDILEGLINSNIYEESFMIWQRNTGVIIENIFGTDGKHIKEYNNIHSSKRVISQDKERQKWLDRERFSRRHVSSKALLNSLLEEIEQFWDSETVAVFPTESIDKMLWIFDKFRVVARQLQSRHGKRNTISINDEYDVQDLLHALLKLYFEDVRKEEWTPSYAGVSSRMDFLLKNEKIVIEVKKTRPDLKDKEVGKQLIEDIAKYRQHSDCKLLLCFVYDPDELIRNPVSLENDLSEIINDFEVRVVIRPKG